MAPTRLHDSSADEEVSEVSATALERLAAAKGESGVTIEDVDPAEWLTQASGLVTVSVEFAPGKALKVAALTEREVNQLLKASERPNPTNPRIRKPDLQSFRRGLVAYSVNKASGKQANDQGFLDPDKLLDVFSGTLTEIQNKVMEVSGFKKAATEEVDSFFA